jgi:hypothetical protein
LACGTIFLNVADYLLHHVTHVEIEKDAWNNLCAAFERRCVGNILQICQKLYKMKEATSV